MVVTDSAGVWITASPNDARTFAAVDSTPLVSLGGPDATGPTQFDRVTSVRLDARGRIWVADGGSAQLRIFNPHGSLRSVFGDRGRGPHEFQSLRILGAFRGDTVAVWDRGNRRVTLFDADGNFLGVRVLPPGDVASPRAYGVFEDGTMVVQVPKVLYSKDLPPQMVLPDSFHFVRLDVSTARTTDLHAPARGPIWLIEPGSMTPLPFTANPAVAVGPKRMYVVDGDAFQVRVFSDDEQVATWRIRRSPRLVTDASRRGWEDYIEQYVPPARQPSYRALLHRPETPRTLPAYTAVLEVGGRVWAGIDRTRTWDVFDASGVYAGRIVMPADFVPMSANDRKVAGVWRDKEDVEVVRVYGVKPM